MATTTTCNGYRYAISNCLYYPTWLQNYNAIAHFTSAHDYYADPFAADVNVFYRNFPGVGSGIGMGRQFVVFDTTSIPSNAVISRVVLHGKASYVGGQYPAHPEYDVPSYINFLRATNPPADGDCDAATIHNYIKSLDLQIGILYVGLEFDDYDFEVALYGAGLASIVKAGYTAIGFRETRDTTSTPPSNTAAWGKLTEMYMDVTYATTAELLVTTNVASDVATTSLTINGEITQGAATKRGFDWGVSAVALINEWYEEGTFGIGAFSHEVTGLTPGQEFCHRAKAYG